MQRETVIVKMMNKGWQQDPTYATPFESGADIRANHYATIPPKETVLISTGIYVEIPEGYEIQIRPRSGLSAKTKLRIANTPGTIDSSYRGEIKIIMENIGSVNEVINEGDRIAQLVLQRVPMILWEKVEVLNQSLRGEDGFGSTGV